MILLGKIAVGMAGTVALTGALAFSEGAISVRVKDKRNPEENLSLVLPAAPAALALKFVPDQHLRGLPRHARSVLPAAEVAAWELARIPDTVLAEVEDGDEHVRVEKQGRRLIVYVDSPRENVHISVPLRTIARCLRTLRNAQPQ